MSNGHTVDLATQAPTTPEAPTARRSTPESIRVARYIETNGLRAVAMYLPPEIHDALKHIARAERVSMQSLISFACVEHYGTPGIPKVPPLVPPTHPKTDPHVNMTWYAPRELHTEIKLLATRMRASVQQLLMSAVIHQYRARAVFRALNIVTGVAAYSRARAGAPLLFRASPPPATPSPDPSDRLKRRTPRARG